MDKQALLEVAYCSDPTWNNGFDPYQQANKNLLTSALETNETLEDLGESNTLDGNNMAPSYEKKSILGLHGTKTVRDVIPTSRLASYGNYEYDQDLERLYTPDFSETQYDTDFPKAASTEVWMLPEVEELFKTYTASTTPLSSDASGFSSSMNESYDYSQCSTTDSYTESDYNSFFMDKCSISTPEEVDLAKRIRCDAVKRLWDTPIDDSPRYRQPSQPPVGSSRTSIACDVPLPSTSQFVMARQYQLWGACNAEYIPIPTPARDNPLSLFDHNEPVSPRTPQYYFPSSSEVSDSSELFPYLQEGSPIPTHSPSYSIPVLQTHQQSRSHSGSPPSAKRIPVYQRPTEQYLERRRHGADLKNLICLSKHDDRRSSSEVDSPTPGDSTDVDVDVDSDAQMSSDINWLLFNYHPRVTTFQQSSDLAEELLVLEREVDEAVQAAPSPPAEEPAAESPGVKLELEKDFPPFSQTQKRASKSRKWIPWAGVPETSAMSEITVDLGAWGTRRTYKDVCVNEAQLSPDSASGFGPLEVDEDLEDDEKLPESIPESFWEPVVKEEPPSEGRGFMASEEDWPALVETVNKRSALKQEEASRDEELDRVSVKGVNATKELSLEVMKEVKEVAEKVVEEVKEVAVAIATVVQEVGVAVSHPSDEDLANKYQGLEEHALETVAGLRRDVVVWPMDAEDADFATKMSLLDVPRLGRTPTTLEVDAADSGSDDGCPHLTCMAAHPDGGYVVDVTFEPRPPRRAQFPLPNLDASVPVAIQPVVPKSPVTSIAAVDLPSEANSKDAFEPCLIGSESLGAESSLADSSLGAALSPVSSSTTIHEEATTTGKPCWQKPQRKKPSSRRKQGKGGSKTRPEECRGGGGYCYHTGVGTVRNALIKIERQMKLARSVASDLSFRYGRRVANFCDVGVGTDDDPRANSELLLYKSGYVEIVGSRISDNGLRDSIDYARALLPPECPSCLDKVGDKLDRIKEHLRAIDAHLWDEVVSRLRFYFNYLKRLRENAKTSTWESQIERSTHFYEIRNRTLVVSSSTFFEGFLPALAFSYEDDTCAPLPRWHRRDEAVCLRRSVYKLAGSTVIIGHQTSSCEDGVVDRFAHTTAYAHSKGFTLTYAQFPVHSPPLPSAGLAGWSVLARLDTAVDRSLRTLAATCSSTAQPAALVKPSVATQTDGRGSKNRMKALSKQLFQAPPAAPKAASAGGGGEGSKKKTAVDQVPKSQEAGDQPSANQEPGKEAVLPPLPPPPPPPPPPPEYPSAASPPKKFKPSHIPVLKSSMRPPRPRTVQAEPVVNKDTADITEVKCEGHLVSASLVNLCAQCEEKDEAVKFRDGSASASRCSLSSDCEPGETPESKLGGDHRSPRSLTPIPPTLIRCPWVHGGAKSTRSPESAPSRKTQWIPEPLRQATARLFKRSRRKQEVEDERQAGDGAEGPYNVEMPGSDDATLKPKMVKDLKEAMEKINLSLAECEKLQRLRSNPEAVAAAEQCCKMSPLGDSLKQEDGEFCCIAPGTVVRQSGNGDAGTMATSDKAAPAATDQSSLVDGTQMMGDRGDSLGWRLAPRK